MRILAVDDEPSILELLTAFLQVDGAHEVVTATSGAEALQIIETSDYDFDCFLLDIQMPVMNGIKLCENIRALRDYFHVPIIMLTAMSQKPYIDSAFSVGATDYVTKPFDLLELNCRLRAAAKISYEYNRACDVAETALRLIGDFGIETKADPEEPLPIEGVERVVSYAGLENFVLALSRTRLLSTSVFAAKIAEFKLLHATLSSRELLAVITTVAQVITEQIPGSGNLVSYRGDGIFLCVSHRRDSIAAGQLQISISDAPSLGDQSASDLTLIFGQKISLVAISKTGVLTALRKAVAAVERQTPPAAELSALSRRVQRTQSRSTEQSHLERRAYEVFLDEIMREERRLVP